MATRMAIEERAGFHEIVDDAAAFRAWYDETLPRVYRYLAARCGDDGLAEELTQQTFVEAIRRRDRFDGRADVVTWLCAIGRNKLIDHYRRHERDQLRQDRLIADSLRHADAPWQSHDVRDRVEAAIATLPGDQRLALLFKHLDGLSVREVATLLGRSEKATESLLSRARESFRRAYGGQAHG
jgi:RNA polymerase sigma-70 factor, ECF subfamily